MTDDVRISVGLPNHPKTKKLKRRIGVDGCWSLIVLFLWVGSERWDGDLSGMTDEDIELAAEWDGESDAFVAAMVEVGFLRGNAGDRFVYAWQEHNPYAAAKGARIAKGKAGAAARWGKANDAPGINSDATGIDQAMPVDATGTAKQCPPAPAPAPAPAFPSDSTYPPSDDRFVSVGVFEGHDERQEPVKVEPATTAAIALRKAGLSITGANPDLIAAIGEGVTVAHLLEAVGLFPGKPARYVISAARREHTEKAAEISADPLKQAVNPAIPRGKPAGPSETKLEQAVSYARHLRNMEQISADECTQMIADATQKHREIRA